MHLTSKKPIAKKSTGLPVVAPQTKKNLPTFIRETEVPNSSEVETVPQAIGSADRLFSLVEAEKFRNSLPRFTIKSVRFSLAGDEMIRKMSVMNCSSQSYSGLHSINSPQMGTVDRSRACGTCGQIDIDCQGHDGRIELAASFPHPLAVDDVIFTLRSVCSNCGHLRLQKSRRNDPAFARLTGTARRREISKIVSAGGNYVMCPRNLEIASKLNKRHDEQSVIGSFNPNARHKIEGDNETNEENLEEVMCPAIQPKYCVPQDKDRWQITASIKLPNGEEQVTQVSIERILNIFRSIPPDDLVVLGFNGDLKPENFIMSVLPVIPERCRPPCDRDGEIKHDHATLVYATIIRQNTQLATLIEKRRSGIGSAADGGDSSLENQISTAMRNLYFLISHLINNTDGELKLRLGEPAITLAERLVGKAGFCRSSAQGKRVNNCARSVIGPAVVPFGAIILPDVMRVVTIPEKVHRFNLARIQRLYEAGEVAHHTPGSGPRCGIRMFVPKIRGSKNAQDIKIGDLVERYATTGDPVIVNRQPTLWRHSMLGVAAIFQKGRQTIGLHSSYTSPMNADQKIRQGQQQQA